MATTTTKGIVKNRNNTSTYFNTNKPVLYSGEIAFETDTNKIKVGDGVNTYDLLPYLSADDPNAYTKAESDNLFPLKTDTAPSADVLATARNITLSGDVSGTVPFDGSTDVDMTVSIVGGALSYTKAESDANYLAVDRTAPIIGMKDIDSLTTGAVRTTLAGILPYQENLLGSSSIGSGTWPFLEAHAVDIFGELTGNAATTTALETPRNIELTGDVTGIVSFDGTADVNIVSTNKVVTKTVTDGETVNLTDFNTVMYADVSAGDVTITIGTIGSDGQSFGVYPTGGFTCYINGTGLTDALATATQAFRAEVINSQLLEIETGGGGGGTGGDSLQLGDIKYSVLNENRVPEGLLQFQFNAVSEGLYPEWFSKCGDMFEQSHLDAGQPASGVGFFYPTPVPGSYGRSGLPDVNFTDAEINVSNTTMISLPASIWEDSVRIGSKVVFKIISGTAPTGLNDGDIVYTKYQSDDTIRLYNTESDAISDTLPITVSTSGSGAFKLTQVGLVIEGAMWGHDHIIRGGTGSAATLNTNGQVLGQATFNQEVTGVVKGVVGDGVNGTPIVTNETRPSTFYEYGYIKVENAIPFEGTPVGGVKYDTGWVANNDWDAKAFNIFHNLSEELYNIDVKFLISTDGTDDNAFMLGDNSFNIGTDDIIRGFQVYQIDQDNIQIITGLDGINSIAKDTGSRDIITSQAYFYRVIVEKKNYASPILDQPAYTNSVVTADNGDLIHLVAQKTIINVDTTLLDKTITIGTNQYDGQEVIVNNIGTANKLTVVDSNGGFIKNASVGFGQSASTTISDGKLLNGDFIFIWGIGDDIPFENGWGNLDVNRPTKIIMQSNKVHTTGIVSGGIAGDNIFTVPVSIRQGPLSTMTYTNASSGQTSEIRVQADGSITVDSFTTYIFVTNASWTIGE